MAKSFADQVRPILTEVMDNLRDKLRDTFVKQGHHLTGGWEDSLEFEIDEFSGGVTAKMTANFYGGILEFGVKASRIPYTSGGPKRGGKSLYIQGLFNYWQQRGLTKPEALRASFATARKQEKEGMPTRKSLAFSQTGKRTGFVKSTIESSFSDIIRIIEARYRTTLELRFGEVFQGLPGIALSSI